MESFRLVVCFTFVLGIVGASRVPVLIWGTPEVGGALPARPLLHTASDEFEAFLDEAIEGRDLVVVFAEETLSPEDLSSRNEDGLSPYPGLKARGSRLAHFPAVPHALSALRDLPASTDDVNSVKLTDEGLSADVHSSSGKFLFVELEDAKEGEDRLRMLARHDAFMNRMFEKLTEKHPSVLAVYTARYPSWEVSALERTKRDTMRHLLAEEDDIPFYNASEKVYLYIEGATLIKGSETVDLTFTKTVDLVDNKNVFEVTLTANDSSTVAFIVEEDTGYWKIENVNLTMEGTTYNLMARDIYAPHGFSFSCGDRVTFTGNNNTETNYKLVFSRFQAQAFFASIAEGRFDSSYDCVGTMSVPIWSGLFVVFLLLFITISGIMMMEDIRTMDRFDDPKGKTITINATE